MSLQRYLATRYVAGGRGPIEYDCWGMTRDAKFEFFGGVKLPECPDAKPGLIPVITREVARVAQQYGMRATEQPDPGHVATAWHGRVCVHVGLVIRDQEGVLRILETDEPTGPCLTRVRHFEQRYSKVVYYAD